MQPPTAGGCEAGPPRTGAALYNRQSVYAQQSYDSVLLLAGSRTDNRLRP